MCPAPLPAELREIPSQLLCKTKVVCQISSDPILFCFVGLYRGSKKLFNIIQWSVFFFILQTEKLQVHTIASERTCDGPFCLTRENLSELQTTSYIYELLTMQAPAVHTSSTINYTQLLEPILDLANLRPYAEQESRIL